MPPDRGWDGPSIGVTHADVSRFTEGDCHILARAIHLETGWPIHAFVYRGGPYLHAFVVMPDGRVLDVEGPRTLDMFRRRWRTREDIAQYDWTTFRCDWGGPWMGPYSYRRARLVAERLLGALT